MAADCSARPGARPGGWCCRGRAEVGARRRHLELLRRGESATLGAILADIVARDARDAQRSTAPLKAAADAVILDTTELDAEEAFAAARAVVDRARPH